MIKEGILKQHFSIKIDYDRLNEYVMDKMLESINDTVDNAELWVEDVDTEVILGGSYTTPYKEFYSRETREEPETDEIERQYLNEDDYVEWILRKLPDNIKNLVTVCYLDEPEDEVEYERQD